MIDPRVRTRRSLLRCGYTIGQLWVAASFGCATTRRRPLPAQWPKPVAIPKAPDFLAHADGLAPLLHGFSPYVGDLLGAPLTPAFVATLAFREAGYGDWFARLVPLLDFERPHHLVEVDGAPIGWYAIHRARVASLRTLLAAYTRRPDGVVVCPAARGASGSSGVSRDPWLLWFDDRALGLAIARTPAGLAAAYDLAENHDPAFLATCSGARARAMGLALPASRVTLRRTDRSKPSALGLELQLDAPDLRALGLDALGEGARSELSDTAPSAVSVAFRVASPADLTQPIERRIARMIEHQGFLVRGVLAELAGRLHQVLRAWDGHAAVALSRGPHALVACGTADPQRAEQALWHLLRGVVDNLALARTFGITVPHVRLTQDAKRLPRGRAHLVSVAKLGAYLPRELAGLAGCLDAKGTLHVAFTVDRTDNCLLVALGPDALERIATWSERLAETRQPRRDHALAHLRTRLSFAALTRLATQAGLAHALRADAPLLAPLSATLDKREGALLLTTRPTSTT